MPNEKHERERVIIESSILAVTLLFIVADLRGMLGEQGMAFVGLLSALSFFFVFAALWSTAAMFDLFPGGPFWALCGGLFFGVGLVMLLVMMLLPVEAGLGTNFAVVLAIFLGGAVIIVLVAWVLTILSHRNSL